MRLEATLKTLANEGRQMLAALVGDLSAENSAAGLDLVVLQDDRMETSAIGGCCQTVMVGPDRQFLDVWQDCIHKSDAVWPIAPETGGILERLCQDVEKAGKTLLTSPSSAVRLAASKLETYKRLEHHGLPAVPTVAWQGRKPRHL